MPAVDVPGLRAYAAWEGWWLMVDAETRDKVNVAGLLMYDIFSRITDPRDRAEAYGHLLTAIADAVGPAGAEAMNVAMMEAEVAVLNVPIIGGGGGG